MVRSDLVNWFKRMIRWWTGHHSGPFTWVSQGKLGDRQEMTWTWYTCTHHYWIMPAFTTFLIIMVLCNCFACFKGVWYCYFYFWPTFCSSVILFKECQNTVYLRQNYLYSWWEFPSNLCFGCWPSSLMLHHQTDHVDQTVFYSISMPLIGLNHL